MSVTVTNNTFAMLSGTIIIFPSIYLICLLSATVIQAGLIDSIAAIDSAKNDTIAKHLPHKKNLTSKYSCLLNKERPPLETAVDAHKPVKYQLKDAPVRKLDVNHLLSEKQVEAIGDAVMAEKLSEKTFAPKLATSVTRKKEVSSQNN